MVPTSPFSSPIQDIEDLAKDCDSLKDQTVLGSVFVGHLRCTLQFRSV